MQSWSRDMRRDIAGEHRGDKKRERERERYEYDKWRRETIDIDNG